MVPLSAAASCWASALVAVPSANWPPVMGSTTIDAMIDPTVEQDRQPLADRTAGDVIERRTARLVEGDGDLRRSPGFSVGVAVVGVTSPRVGPSS